MNGSLDGAPLILIAPRASAASYMRMTSTLATWVSKSRMTASLKTNQWTKPSTTWIGGAVRSRALF
jgi:hypothetical protein